MVFKKLNLDKLIALLLFLAVISLGYILMVPEVCGLYHDDAIYTLTAKAIAQGDGYRLINLPGAPYQTKYPIIFPAILSIIWKIWPSFPDNLLAMQWLSLLFGGAFVGLTYLYLVAWGYASRQVAFLASALTATSPMFLDFCTKIMSEMPFAFFLIVSLFALERYLISPTNRRLVQVGLGMLLTMPYLTRSIGLVIIPAALAVIFFKKKPYFWVALGAVIAAAPWAIWALQGFNSYEFSALRYYTDYLSWWQNSTGIDIQIKITLINLLLACLYIVMSGMFVFSTIIGLVHYSWIAFIFLGLLSLALLIREIRYRPVLPVILISYILLFLIWPWPPNRFLIVVLPFLFTFLLKPFAKLFLRIPEPGRQRRIGVMCVCLLISVNLLGVHDTFKGKQEALYKVTPDPETWLQWSSYQEILGWIRNNTKLSEIIISERNPLLYIYTGRRGIRPDTVQPMALFYGEKMSKEGIMKLTKIIKTYQPGFWVSTPIPNKRIIKYEEEFLDEVKKQYPDLLRTVFTASGDSRFVIYQINNINKQQD